MAPAFKKKPKRVLADSPHKAPKGLPEPKKHKRSVVTKKVETIEDDDEDLMEAAATGKYDDDAFEDNLSDANDDWEDPSDDESTKETNEEKEPTEETEQGTKKKLSRKAIKIRGGELEGMKETAELFKSNIFKLEIEELLAEVSAKYEHHKALEKALHHIKAVFDVIPDGKEMLLHDFKKDMLKKNKIETPFPHPQPAVDANYKFAFKRPVAMHIVGGYALKAVAKLKDPFNVDVAVEMPESVFQEKDSMNHRYFYKRACYLAVLAHAIKKSNLGLKLEFSTLNGDMRKPVLLVKPTQDKSEVDFTKTKCVIRIMPCISSQTFPVPRLAPGRNNVRSKEDENETLKPTPHYNASLLMDTTFTSNLAFLYQHSKACAAFKDSMVLAKTWLHQRGLTSTHEYHSGFNAFLFSMLTGYLLQGGKTGTGKKLANGHSSYQLVRGTIDFLATHDFKQDPVFIGHSDREEFSVTAFSENYDVVIVDISGTVNLAAKMTLAALSQLQHEAKLAMAYFNDTTDRFEALFLKNAKDIKCKFDNLLRLSASKATLQHYDQAAKADYANPLEFFAKKVGNILEKGLTNRADLISVDYTTPATWSVDASVPETDEQAVLTIGLILNSDHAPRLVDQGPDPQQKEAAQAFRDFWGKKSELRRFKDGSIVESVVWQTHGYENKSLIVQKIVSYLLHHHLSIAAEDIHYWAGQLYPFINYSKSTPENLLSPELCLNGFQPLMAAFSQFTKQLRSVDSALPLVISNIYPAAASLRQSTVSLPHPVDFASISNYPTTLRYIDAIDVIVQLERSSRWPEDLGALQNVKQAFYLKIAEQLKATTGASSVPVQDICELNPLASNSYLDVYFHGFVFRCHLHVEQEGEVLKAIIASKRETKSRKELATKALTAYETQFIHQRAHTFAIQAVCNRFTAYSSTVRLVKRWFGCHLLSSQVPEEWIELVCAATFLESQPWVPATSAMSGFSRVLELLATWDWQRTPLIVDLEGDMSTSVRETITKKFDELRSQNPQITQGAMVVATSQDLEGKWWSSVKPSKVMAIRIQALAKASCSVLDQIILSGESKDIKRVFATPMDAYSVILPLKTERCTRYFQSLHPQAKFMSTTHSVGSDMGDCTYAGFDPVTEFVHEIERTFGHSVMVFYNKYGGDKIALVWDPTVAVPKLWKVRIDYNSVPVDMTKRGILKPAKDSKEVSKLAQPNFEAILFEIKRLGEGLV
ncbi:Nrap protein [Spinellus fusiger]|nr:Nrap protein [Spinellus fusiger]